MILIHTIKYAPHPSSLVLDINFSLFHSQLLYTALSMSALPPTSYVEKIVVIQKKQSAQSLALRLTHILNTDQL